MAIPKEKLNAIFQDPEFLSLGDEEKDNLLSAINQTYAEKPQPQEQTKPSIMDVVKNSIMPGSPIIKPIMGAYEAVKKPVVDFAVNTPGPLNLYSKLPEMNIESPLAQFTPQPIRNAIFPKVPITGPTAANAVAGMGVDALAMGGAEMAGSKLLNVGKGLSRAASTSKDAFENFLQSSKTALSNTGKNEVNFLGKIRTEFQAQPINARKAFSSDLVRLNNEAIASGKNYNVNLRGMVDDLQAQIVSGEESPIIRRAINRSPKLKKIFNNPDLSERLTLKESQDLLNEVKGVMSEAKLSGRGNRPTDIPLYEDVINEISQAQLDVHPEFAKTKEIFGGIMNDWKLIRNRIKPGSLSSNLTRGFGDPELKDAAKRLLKESPQTLKLIDNYAHGKFARKFIKEAAVKGAEYGLPATGVGWAISKFFNRKNVD